MARVRRTGSRRSAVPGAIRPGVDRDELSCRSSTMAVSRRPRRGPRKSAPSSARRMKLCELPIEQDAGTRIRAWLHGADRRRRTRLTGEALDRPHQERPGLFKQSGPHAVWRFRRCRRLTARFAHAACAKRSPRNPASAATRSSSTGGPGLEQDAPWQPSGWPEPLRRQPASRQRDLTRRPQRFTNEFIDARRAGGDIEKFRRRYRSSGRAAHR